MFINKYFFFSNYRLRYATKLFPDQRRRIGRMGRASLSTVSKRVHYSKVDWPLWAEKSSNPKLRTNIKPQYKLPTLSKNIVYCLSIYPFPWQRFWFLNYLRVSEAQTHVNGCRDIGRRRSWDWEEGDGGNRWERVQSLCSDLGTRQSQRIHNQVAACDLHGSTSHQK